MITTWSFKEWLFQALQPLVKKVVLRLPNGMELDIATRKVTIPYDMDIHFEGNLKLHSDKHLILESGKTPDTKYPHQNHAVWVNPEYDAEGYPLLRKLENDIVDEGTGSSCNCHATRRNDLGILDLHRKPVRSKGYRNSIVKGRRSWFKN